MQAGSLCEINGHCVKAAVRLPWYIYIYPIISHYIQLYPILWYIPIVSSDRWAVSFSMPGAAQGHVSKSKWQG